MKFNWITISLAPIAKSFRASLHCDRWLLVVAVVDTFFAWPRSSLVIIDHQSSLIIIGHHLFLDNDHHHSGHRSTCSDHPPVPDMLIVQCVI